MANVKISQLPPYTSSTDGDLVFVNNNVLENETTKILLREFAGLTIGGGLDSIVSNRWLNINEPATGTGVSSIAIGYGAEATSDYSIAIGHKPYNTNRDGTRDGYIALGYFAQSVQYGVSIGYQSDVGGSEGIAIGRDASVNGNGGIALGYNADSGGGNNSIAIGRDSLNAGNSPIVIGYSANNNADSAVVIGPQVSNSIVYGVAIGGSGQTLSTGSANSSINSFDGEVSSSAKFNGQLNANDSIISGSTSGATMIGTMSRIADDDDTTYVENLRTFGQYYSNGSLQTGSTITVDMNNGNVHHIQVDNNLSLTLTNVKNGGRYCIITTTTGNFSISSKTASGFTFKVDSGFDTLGNAKTHKLTLDVIGNVIYGTSTADLT